VRPGTGLTGLTGLTASTAGLARDLRSLARLCGIQSSYTGQDGRRVKASLESLLAAVRAFGMPVEDLPDVPAALGARVAELTERPLPPVIVAWDGRMPVVDVGLASSRSGDLELVLESGEVAERRRVRGGDGRSIGFEAALPLGYHRLLLEAGSTEASALVIAAPERAPAAPGRSWGVFVPLYALRTARDRGVGDLTDLGDLTDWVAGLGGDVVATLPLLASFLDEPFEPSPYSPASRLFWNEVYLDVNEVPELERSPEAREALSSSAHRAALEQLRAAGYVDYRAVMAAKRAVLEPMARAIFDGPSPRRDQLEAHVAANPALADYAAFRAACERTRSVWSAWPEPDRSGRLTPDDADEPARRYHRYVQWLAAGQVDAADRRARAAGAGLYFDFPLGVNPGGYDVWREREAFALGASAGAPPDPFFTSGQDWGFHPLHPERIRDQGYRYPIACLRHLLRHARVLRLDHVMGLHRLYWIPRGVPSTHGVYVRYAADELYAIVCLEAHRAGTVVVGEDLGVVPDYVRPAMARHEFHRTYVLPWELTDDPAAALRPAPSNAFASLNTHDMEPFAGFWEGTPAEQRELLVAYLRERGWLAAGDGDEAPVSTADVMAASLRELAAGEAREVVVTLEDLWQETRPQNVPGTVDEYPNWRRRATRTLEEIREDPEAIGVLRDVDGIRRHIPADPEAQARP
jgi:4-alpha-glucanotransferase